MASAVAKVFTFFFLLYDYYERGVSHSMTNSLCMVIFSSAVVAHLPSLTTTGNHFHFLARLLLLGQKKLQQALSLRLHTSPAVRCCALFRLLFFSLSVYYCRFFAAEVFCVLVVVV